MANREQALQRKCNRLAPQNIAEGEEEEEKGATSPAAEQLQIQRETITPMGKQNPVIQQQVTQYRKAPPPLKPVCVSSAQARSQKDPGAIA